MHCVNIAQYVKKVTYQFLYNKKTSNNKTTFAHRYNFFVYELQMASLTTQDLWIVQIHVIAMLETDEATGK